MANIKDKIKNIYKKKNSGVMSYTIVIGLYLVMEILMKTGNLTNLIKSLLVPCVCYIIVAVALNLCVGLSGELSLGHAGFMSIGAFTSVVVSGTLEEVITNDILRLVIAVIAAALVASIIGYLVSIPVLKLEGDYLAIVTLAFGQIIKSIIGNIYLGIDEKGFQFSFIEDTTKISENGKMLISGPTGATGISRISTFTAAVVLCIIALIIVYHLINSKDGRAIMAARDNRIASLSVGINVTRTKTLAFVMSVMLAGAAGAIYGLNYSSISPAKFDFNQSILILVYVVLGGLGNINGTIIAATLLYILPEMLRSLADYRMLIYALILIVIMLVTNNDKLKNRINELLRRKKKHE